LLLKKYNSKLELLKRRIVRHFLSFEDYSREEILEIVEIGRKIKSEMANGVRVPYLQGQTLGMIFEKSSTRTRVSFESGMFQLGGSALFLSSRDIQLGRGEPIKDTSKVISSMLDMLMVRTFEHEKIENFAKYSSVPVINGLTDLCHPVQIIADYITALEDGIEKPVIAYVGDGNNVANSWVIFASKLGLEIRVAAPKGYELNNEVLQKSLKFAEESGAKIIIGDNPKEAVKGATVVTTDTWVSMGQEEEKEQRVKDFDGYIVDESMMQVADKDAIFLHCLPAYRGYEVSESVIDGSQSRIYEEAENRLHGQKGLMVWLNQNRK
jgi:ornithine carbamoyltransferase